MARRCASCGGEGLPAESRYCLHCGAPSPTAPDLGDRHRPATSGYTPAHLAEVLNHPCAPEGERKEVTILVADVAGSLAMAHRLDPEDMHVLMDGFFILALDAVHGEQGTLNQFRGDGFMALFGAPLARAEHARDAVRAALAIRRAAESYTLQVRARYGLPLVLRMGIHTGSVWVGSIGSRLRLDYTAEGPAVGVAVRLEQNAAPGQILISAETARRVRDFFELRSVGTLALRGAPEPAEAFLVVGAGAHESALDAERAAGLVPFSGRATEIARARAGLENVPRGGAGWVDLVGEPGIGKSRLALELRLCEGGTWLEGRCRESSRMRAYGAWLDLLRRWPTPGEARVEHAVRLLEGREGRTDPAACERALRDVLEASYPGDRPLSILLEDVQWMDASSWELATALLEGPPAAGVRFLVTRRHEPGAHSELPPNAVRITLGPLDPAHAQALALAALAACERPEPLALLAAQRGGGHPLYVLEVARALGEGDPELRDAARMEASWRQTRARLPDTLRGVIAARIDGLPKDAKQLLEVAAVIGRPFTEAFLAGLDDGGEEVVRERLAPLLERSLLVRRAAELDFAHVLHREVAYEQMLRARRCELHRRCALLLAAAGATWTAGTASEIGRHYDEAGEPRLAARALARAGEGYLDLLAAREAVSHLRRGWELVNGSLAEAADPALRTRTGLTLARALNTLDRAGEAASVLESLDPDGVTGGELAQLAGAWIESAWVRFSESGEVRRSLALLDRGIALAGADRALEGRAHVYRTRMCHLDGAVTEAAASARRVTELATAAGDRLGVVIGLGNEGYVRCDAGELPLALSRCEEALALAHETRQEVAIALAAGWLAKVHAYRGDGDAALREAAVAREIGRRTAQEGAVYNAELWTGYVHLLRDEPKRALEAFERLAEINDRWPTTLDWLALARLEAGRLEEAAQLARRCLDGDPPRLVRLRVLRTLGLALGLGPHPDRDAAEQALGEALSLAVELGLRPHVAEVHAGLADLCRRAGNPRPAAYYSRRAEREWEACGMPAHAERARGARA